MPQRDGGAERLAHAAFARILHRDRVADPEARDSSCALSPAGATAAAGVSMSALVTGGRGRRATTENGSLGAGFDGSAVTFAARVVAEDLVGLFEDGDDLADVGREIGDARREDA